jgi:hypothetical protein
MHAALRGLRSHQSLEALVRAWHHAQLSSPASPKPQRDHQHESPQGLDGAEGLLDTQCERLQVLVFEKLDAIVPASSLVALVNSFMRPYLHSSTGHITQETLNLILFYQNHRRYKSGKRQGKAPSELLTGEALEVDWMERLIQHTPGTSPDSSLTSSSPLALVSHDDEPTTPSQMPPGPEALAPSTEAVISWSPLDAEAA